MSAPVIEQESTHDSTPDDNKYDVDKIFHKLVQDSDARAKLAREKLEKVIKRYETSRIASESEETSLEMRQSISDAVEATDLIIGELLEAIDHQEKQRVLFEEQTSDRFQSILEEQIHHTHQTTLLYQQYLTEAFEEALAFVEVSSEKKKDIQDLLTQRKISAFGPDSSLKSSMTNWGKQLDSILKQKYKLHGNPMETEVSENVLENQPNMETLHSINSQNGHTHPPKSLMNCEKKNKGKFVCAKVKKVASKREKNCLKNM